MTGERQIWLCAALREAYVLDIPGARNPLVAEEPSALFFAPFVSSQLGIQHDWIDCNGHLNMAFYNVLFDRAVDEAFGLCGLGPDYIRERGGSFFLVESRIRYRRELTLSDKVRVTLQLLDFDDKRLHYCMEIRHASAGWLAAACDNISIHVNLQDRRAAPFPADIVTSLACMKTAHAGLPYPDWVGEGVAMPRKTLPN
jgi:acyl-CoA thioester hydrolase